VARQILSNTGVVVLDGSLATGWRALTWMGQAVGGADLADTLTDGPTGDPVPSREEP
jgi:probable phosphoglycerate mutase